MTVGVVYGVDVQALQDLPDPEVICSEQVAAIYAAARRLTTPTGALQEIGETGQYDSIDIRDWLGARFNLTDQTVLRDLEAQATQVLLDDPFIFAVQAVVTFGQGVLSLTVQAQGATGPFSFVLNATSLTVQLLLPGQT